MRPSAVNIYTSTGTVEISTRNCCGILPHLFSAWPTLQIAAPDRHPETIIQRDRSTNCRYAALYALIEIWSLVHRACSNQGLLSYGKLNPLNAELNLICHLVILLGDLTFMGTCTVSISKKMQRYTVYLYLETAPHVSGGTSTHHQERIRLYLQHLVFVTPLLLSDAIVEEFEPVWVCCGWRTPHTAHWNRFQLFHDSVR
jgi:hypothetical protein